MRTALKTALVILVAIISVPLAEAGMIIWLGLSDELFDVTGNIWLLGILPVVFLLVTLQTLALWPIYRQNPLRYGLIYAILYPPAHAFPASQIFEQRPGGIIQERVGPLAAAIALVDWRRGVEEVLRMGLGELSSAN